MNPDHDDHDNARQYDNARKEDEILIACALRFDGYKYVTNRRFDHIAAFRTIERTGDLAPFERPEHLALFFMMQRFLYKWGGETLSRHSPEWRTFRELFFLCCRARIPKAYRFEPYYSDWERIYAPRLEECIALVRRVHRSTKYQPRATAHPSPQPKSGINGDHE